MERRDESTDMRGEGAARRVDTRGLSWTNGTAPREARWDSDSLDPSHHPHVTAWCMAMLRSLQRVCGGVDAESSGDRLGDCDNGVECLRGRGGARACLSRRV